MYQLTSAISISIYVLWAGLLSVLAYSVMRISQKGKSAHFQDPGAKFRPRLGFTNLDGGVALSLILENASDAKIWVEHGIVSLSGLTARYQTIPATQCQTCEIHQTVEADQMLPFSIVGSIYEAAGRPQGTYSCIVSASVRYKVSEQCFERELPSYAVKMAAMTMIDARRVRSPGTKSERNGTPHRDAAKSSGWFDISKKT